MKDYTVRHDALTAEEFRSLWESVWGGAPSLEQTRLAMDNSLHRVSVYDGDTPIAMARMIGDRGSAATSRMWSSVRRTRGRGSGGFWWRRC